MEKVFRYSFLLCAAALLPACAGEPDLEPDSSPVQEDCVYMDVGLSFSSGEVRTRSNTGDPSDGYVTSDDGTEPGKDRENAIAEVLLLIADTQDNNIAAGLLETSGDGLDFVIPVPFRRLKDHAGEEVHVYVFCNPTDKLKSLAVNTPEGTLPSDFKDMEHTLQDFTEDPAWTDGHFIMSNARMYTSVLPDDWSDYRSVSDPFPLVGEDIQVERSVARVDYRTVRTDNTYPVSSSAADPDDTDNPGVMIRLDSAAFFNVGRSFYYLRRVAGENLSGITLCGAETQDNYVVDTGAEYKLDISGGWDGKSGYYYSNIEDPDSWEWTDLSDLEDTEEDNVWGGDAGNTVGYHIWRYITENAAPSRESQVWSVSTGIAFKAKIVAGSGCDQALADVLGKGEEKIYVYDGILYGTWEMTREAGEQDADLRVAWNAVESNGVSLSDAGFTEYTPVDGEYVCYYFYRIVHNDDGADASAVPGPMKYAVVRNNVYKIAVEAVTAFGLTDNTPTEDEYSYMMVTVDVVPWVDREYEIVIDE